MDGLPVTIRLLDPPLHEFLPHDDKSQAAMAKELGITAAAVKARVAQLHEMNPMLGHRGCRLAVTYPEILEMQVRAIIEAVIACKEKKINAIAEIMIPLVGTAKELAMLADQVRATMRAVEDEKKYKGELDILVGTMIEIPRAALTADEIGAVARVLQLRHERPDADDVRLQPRRHQHLPAGLPQAGTLTARSVPVARHGGRGPARGDGRARRAAR